MAETVHWWGKVQRPWGWEVRVDFDDGTLVLHEVVNLPFDPSEAQIDEAIDGLRAKIAQIRYDLAHPVADPDRRELLITIRQHYRQVLLDLWALLPSNDEALAMTKTQLLQVLQSVKQRLLDEVEPT